MDKASGLERKCPVSMADGSLRSQDSGFANIEEGYLVNPNPVAVKPAMGRLKSALRQRRMFAVSKV